MMRAILHSMRHSTVVVPESPERGNAVEIDGYLPNPNGLFEAGGSPRRPVMLRSWERTHLDKSAPPLLIKIFFDSLINIPAGDHKIIYMVRDPEEIKKSCDRLVKYWKEVSYPGQPAYSDYIRGFDVYRKYSREDEDHVIDVMMVRRDVELIVVDYGDLINDTHRQFERVRELVSPLIDIDVGAAVKLIDPALYRSRGSYADSEDIAHRASA
jgi:hypothetical protein